jgi:putative sugar O-methyltransferase
VAIRAPVTISDEQIDRVTQHDRFVRNSLDMHAALGQLEAENEIWSDYSKRIIAQVRGSDPDTPLASTRHYYLDKVGAGSWQADYPTMRVRMGSYPVFVYQRLVRRLFGYGRLGQRLLGPFADAELTRLLLEYSRVHYTNSVTSGYLLLRDLIERHDISSPALYGDQRVDVGGRLITWKTLLALKQAQAISTRVGPAGTVLEIGGGTGELARLMLRMGLAERYIVVDIPPALAFAQEAVRSEVADSELSFFRPEGPTAEEVARARCTFLLPHHLDAITHADVGVNIISFHTMTRAQVHSYASSVKRVGVSQFVSINERVPHITNRPERVDERFYEETFGTEFRVDGRFAWDKSLDTALEPHGDNYVGFQFLHFVRSTHGRDEHVLG